MSFKYPGPRSAISSPFDRQIKFAGLRSVLAFVLCWSFLLSGCSPFYVFRAAYEEGKILWRREPIERLLQNSQFDPETREKLRLVLDVREYARDVLKLRVGGSYASYSYIDRKVLSYVVMAAPQTDLSPYTWWFLLVGRVPYKGFFSQEAAKAEADRLRGRQYDTYIRTTEAFSTLGWFDDPLLAHLLRYDKVTLAEVIFHELLHNTLFISGAVDFNESLANFVGNQGAVLFFHDRYGPGSPEHQRAVQAWEDELEFSRFITQVAGSLSDLYGKDLPLDEKLRLKQEIFTRSQAEWTDRIKERPAHRFRGYVKQELNNAVIAHYLLYLKDLEVFESLYQAEGGDLPRVLDLVRDSLRSGDDPFKAVRGLVRSTAPASPGPAPPGAKRFRGTTLFDIEPGGG